ncbi:putative acyl-CoA dehydrogenase [Achromobacter spanius]|uniref:acyl-CoA dehydrogenase family protein n=1 Tax=Achromobacter spanius TaxID=217203 RepID=UPI000D95389D|nr:acyl-CoA dehydrogenase family protein [Achromobacter spanius]CAB3658972.1 Acyl-CoA dehydrogenase FadE27 [Achromobacter spanius]SPT39917.1 putative acyl-CoA dehydrogenase [Achromobacter denitrificans]VEE59160.1 putative acyl-CoA dehydrogenase [Achromobacter spanius]
MTFSLSEDQRMLQEAAGRFLADRHPPSVARAAATRSAHARLALWREIAEQGWPALLAPAGHDGLGLGLGMREAWVVAEAAGRHLLSLPLVANMVVLPTLCEAGAAGPVAKWAQAMMQGEMYFADAAMRPDGSAFIEGAGAGVPALALGCVGPGSLRLERHAPLSGIGGTAGTSGISGTSGIAGIPGTSGISATAGLDPTMPVARVACPDVQEAIELQVDARLWRRLKARMTLLRSAELLGAASAALDMAAAYARERRQFDRAIGANQAIKHRLADDWMALDDARLAGMAAAASHDADAPSADRDSLYVPLLAVEGGRRAVQNAIQVHGALGITWECDAHLYLKRVLRLAASLHADASCTEWLERIWEGADADRAAA